MKILVVCQYYYPEEFKINDICNQLVKIGHNVTVLTGLPNYPFGKIPKEYSRGQRRKENISGVEVIRCFEIPRNGNKYGLALNYISYALSATIKTLSLARDFDIIFCYQLSPITMIIPAVFFKFITRTPIFTYCCDLWPESIKSIVNNEDSLVFKITKYISAFLYSRCDYIAVSSKHFINYLTNLNRDMKYIRMSFLAQHAEDEYLEYDFSPIKNNCIDFMFMGNVGYAQDIECLIAAVDLIKDVSNFKVHIVGDGSNLSRCISLVAEKNIEDKFIFHGRHNATEMNSFYKIADACVLTLKNDNFTGLTIPSKLQGYMAAGKTVLGAINGSAQEIINDSKCGLCVNASDEVGLSRIMLEFINNYNEYVLFGQNGRVYFRNHFTRSSFIKKLIQLLEETLREAKNV